MRINIVTGPFLAVPPAPCGAVERVWYDLAAIFVDAGHDVTIYTRRHPSLPGREGILPNRVPFRTLAPFTAGRAIAVNLAKDLAYALHAVARMDRAEITVTNTFWLPLVAPLRRARLGCIYACIQRVPKGQVQMYRRAGVARFMAVSSAIRDFIVEEDARASHLTKVIPNPIRTEVFTPPALARDYEGERRVIFTGRIHPEKGLELLLQAFRVLVERHPAIKTRLLVVGPHTIGAGGGGEDFLARLRGLADGLPVDFREPIYDRAQLAELLRSGHVYTYPSLAEKGEAFGIAPLEGMATGLVPIVSDLAVFRDFVEKDVNGFVFQHRGPEAVSNLAGALERALLAPADVLRSMSMAAAGKATAFGVGAVAARILADFEELLRT